ncbi:MAG: hypothetical protein GX446_18080 [Chthonomonadales bacterium]|nr:hypothetical protein [Chthonomonadales bacterium]
MRVKAISALALALMIGVWLSGNASSEDAARAKSPDAPRVLTRDLDNLNGPWRFRTDPQVEGETLGWQLPDADDADWKLLNVPGYWEPQGITDTRPGQPPRPKGTMPYSDYDGTAWYRKRFIVPSEWAGKPLLLTLGSVDDGDRTFVNGKLVGETPLTKRQAVLIERAYRVAPDLIKPGAANVIAVCVTDGGGPGGMMGPNVSLVPEDYLTAPVRLPSADRPLADRFADPPADSRMLKIIHGWPDEAQAQDALIRTLAQQGFGGVVCNVSFTEYLRSEAKWAAFVRAVNEAKKAGMAMWLYDEKGYPSGSADGLTLEGHPEYEAQGLLIADAITNGEPVELQVPPGKLRLAAAVPLINGRMDRSRLIALTPRDGKIAFQPDNGQWHVMAITEDRLYEGTHAANSFGDRLPYIDLLAPEPTARYLQVTHDAYAWRLGADLGKYFVSTFTDEPSLMSLFLRRMPYRVLPWSPVMAREFRARRGYDIGDRLPLLVTGDGPEAMKARYDFWKTVGELVSDSFFGQIQRWCARHGVRSGGHLLYEENLSYHVPFYGDFMACARRLDAPSIDCLTSVPSEVPWFIARLMGSVADLEGRSVTMSETSDFGQTYRAQGDTRPVRVVTEAEIRGTCNRQMLGGINTITSYYTFRELSGEQLRRINAYVGRCSTMLRGGHQVTDVAVVYPIESAWVRFRPSRHLTSEAPETQAVERTFRRVSDALYGARRDFTYVDSKAILNAKVSKGALVHGKLRWRVVVLPHADTLPLACWKKLEAFAKSGGILISVAARPLNTEAAFPSADAKQLAETVFGRQSGMSVRPVGASGVGVYLPAGSEHMLGPILDSLIEPEVAMPDRSAPVRATHRRIDGHEVFFLINDSATPWSGSVSVCASGDGELWDPMTGARRQLSGPNGVKVVLEPYAGTFLRYASARAPRRKALQGGELPDVVMQPLTPSSVEQAAGTHVAASVRRTGQVWEATGAIRKSDVDTFMFAVMRFDRPADLSRAEFLSLPVSVPTGQRSAPQLLVIVTDSKGVQYWAETGRSLTAAGRADVVLPLQSFSHAPFSQGPAGALDWSSVAAVNVGWGGHFGKEGDVIAFTVGVPRVGRIGRK